MRILILTIAALSSAPPAYAVECTSVEGKLMGEAISIVRGVTWNGLNETLMLKSSKVSGGSLSGETMAEEATATRQSCRIQWQVSTAGLRYDIVPR